MSYIVPIAEVAVLSCLSLRERSLALGRGFRIDSLLRILFVAVRRPPAVDQAD